ncbi:cytochrome b-c1 complex subunit 6, mitochondrial-like [Lineus longissimus]|uniref:cytochrome b-c1 complex subunit 6, mitochondrial-like n=1 Tax=Lineus longissimus TaxID=88925 RepID=UPI002B4E5386
MALGDEKAITNTAGGEPEAEEEEEEDLVDTQDVLKEKCQQTKECQKYYEELQVCTSRVAGKSNTEETCDQELYDFIHCTDHCVSKSLFENLK